MMPCDRIAARSMVLASLPPEDPERANAEAHAASCASCERALRQGAQLLALVKSELRAVPSSEALRRAERGILDEMDRERPGTPVRVRVLASFGAAVAFAGMIATARHAPHDLASWVVAGGVASLAALLAALASEGARTALAAIGSSLALALLASSGDGLFAKIGAKCLALELGCALVPFALFAAARGLAPRPASPGASAALAGAAALAGQAALHLSCPVHGAMPHLFAFHVAGVVLAALLGARVLASRPT